MLSFIECIMSQLKMKLSCQVVWNDFRSHYQGWNDFRSHCQFWEYSTGKLFHISTIISISMVHVSVPKFFLKEKVLKISFKKKVDFIIRIILLNKIHLDIEFPIFFFNNLS